jgi:hypothetical protein
MQKPGETRLSHRKACTTHLFWFIPMHGDVLVLWQMLAHLEVASPPIATVLLSISLNAFQGFTAILMAHSIEEALALGDRRRLIQDGHMALDQPVACCRP